VRSNPRFWLGVAVVLAIAIALLTYAGLRMGDSPEQPPEPGALPAQASARV